MAPLHCGHRSVIALDSIDSNYNGMRFGFRAAQPHRMEISEKVFPEGLNHSRLNRGNIDDHFGMRKG